MVGINLTGKGTTKPNRPLAADAADQANSKISNIPELRLAIELGATTAAEAAVIIRLIRRITRCNTK